MLLWICRVLFASNTSYYVTVGSNLLVNKGWCQSTVCFPAAVAAAAAAAAIIAADRQAYCCCAKHTC